MLAYFARMNRIDRLFGIVTLLQSRKFLPAEKIATRFGISLRTVYRDVRSLCEQGIPVSFEQGRGYFIVQGYFLPPVAFSSEEAQSLLLIEGLVSSFADESVKKHFSNLLNKVRSVLHHRQKEKLELLQTKIRLQVPDFATNNFEFLATLQEAILQSNIVQLQYKNQREEISSREVEPIGLIFYAFSWHLIAWCHQRQAYRDFKVARIIHIRNTQQPFRKKEHRGIGEFMKQLPVAY